MSLSTLIWHCILHALQVSLHCQPRMTIHFTQLHWHHRHHLTNFHLQPAIDNKPYYHALTPASQTNSSHSSTRYPCRSHWADQLSTPFSYYPLYPLYHYIMSYSNCQSFLHSYFIILFFIDSFSFFSNLEI